MLFPVVQPPSHTNTEPFMYWLLRQTSINGTMSRTCPQQPRGTELFIFSTTASFLKYSAVSGVSIMPGAMALTVIPFAALSWAKALVNPTMPALAAE